MRFHLVAMPHTQSTAAYSNCAFNTLTRNFAKMMTGLGHEVILYSGEDNDATVTEHVTCITKERQRELFNVEGPDDILKAPLDTNMYDPHQPWWREWNLRVSGELISRAYKGDFLCLIGGGVLFDPLIQVAEKVGMIPNEYAIGYGGIHDRTWHCFGSSNWQHMVWGMRNPAASGYRGKAYDRVIPHYFDPDDFEYRAGGDYLLYLGKLKEDKGVNVAARAAKAAGRKLLVAGEGPTPVEYGDTVGRVGPDERRELLAGAAGLFVPSLYAEPFGMVAVEGLLSGTPIITTPWGGLGDINQGGVGFVCNTLADFVHAAENVDVIDPETCFNTGMSYSLRTIAPQYDKWFSDLTKLYTTSGWDYLG